MSFGGSPVATVSGSGTNTFSTAAIDTTGADTIIVRINFFSVATPTLSDSVGNTFVGLTSQTQSNDRIRIFYVQNATTNAAHVFTLTGAGSFSSIFVQAWTGGHLTTLFDQESGTTSTSSTIQPGSITPSTDGCLIFAGFTDADTGGTTCSIDSGFTQPDAFIATTVNFYGGTGSYLVQGSATAVNPTATFNGGSPQLAAVMASFKPASYSPVAMPFSQKDWQNSSRKKAIQAFQLNNNLALFSGGSVGGSPFSQLNWPNPAKRQSSNFNNTWIVAGGHGGSSPSVGTRRFYIIME